MGGWMDELTYIYMHR